MSISKRKKYLEKARAKLPEGGKIPVKSDVAGVMTR